MVMFGYHPFYGVDCDLFASRGWYNVSQSFVGKVDGKWTAYDAGTGYYPDQCALELPDVSVDLLGDEQEHVVRHVQVLGCGLLMEDCRSRLEVRRLDIGDKSALEAGAKAFL